MTVAPQMFSNLPQNNRYRVTGNPPKKVGLTTTQKLFSFIFRKVDPRIEREDHLANVVFKWSI